MQTQIDNTNNIIDIDQLYNIFGDSNIVTIYTMKFACNAPVNEVIHSTYNGKIYDMPYKINDIINYSKFFELFMKLFKNYHEQLDVDDPDYYKKFSPLQLKIRVRRDKDPFILDYSYVIDYKENTDSHDSICV